MSLTKAMIDVRNMKRSVSLRQEVDPAKIVETLEQILKDSVVAQASGSRTFQKKAYEELVNVRRDLAAGQVNAGLSTGPMTGVFSHLIDQMDAIQDSEKESRTGFNKAINHLQNSIPSTDTFIAALMTANPLMGYGIKIMRDISRAGKAARDARKEESKKRDKVLTEQQKYVQEQLSLLAVEEKAADQQVDIQDEQVKQMKKERTSRRGVYTAMLEKIHEELVDLRKEWTGTLERDGQIIEGEYQRIVDIESNTENSVSQIERLTDAVDEQTEANKDNLERQIDATNKSDMMDDRDSQLTRLKENGEEMTPIVNDELKKGIEDQKGGLHGLLNGLMAPVMAVVRSGVAVFAGAALAFVTQFVAIPALIGTAIYKFLDGFFNAEEIIGKSSADITWLDRVKAAVSNIWGSIIRIVDWVGELFGFDLIDSDKIEKRIYGLLDKGQQKIVSIYENAMEYLGNTVENIMSTVQDWFKNIEETFTKIKDFFSDKLGSLTDLIDKIPFVGKEGFGFGDWWGSNEQAPTEKPLTSPADEDVPMVAPVQPDPKSNITVQPPRSNELNSSVEKAEQKPDKSQIPNAAPPIVAPNTQNNNIHNHQYNGPPSTNNGDKDFRSTQGRNGRRFIM